MEVSDALQGLGLELVTPIQMGIVESPEEEFDTFEENAEQKARFYYERTGITTLADDSGIIVEALKDELGIHTRRWGAGKHATDQEWIEHFLKRMESETNRRARFVCVLALVGTDNNTSFFEGWCEGTITHGLEAEYLTGLPLSACFKPDGSEKVFSALKLEEKAKFSHRGKALFLLREFLQSLLDES